jgi:hypothetical protein
MCGAHHAPPVEPIVRATERSAPFTNRTAWRSQPFKRTQPVLPAADVTPIDSSDPLAVGDEAEETASELSEDRVAPEQEPDDGDVLSLVDHDAPDTADQ